MTHFLCFARITCQPKVASSILEEVKGSLQGILNKLTPEKYDVLYDSLLQMRPKLLSSEVMAVIVQLIIDKALREPSFSAVYARLVDDLSRDLKGDPT